jgi:hypothetical protein
VNPNAGAAKYLSAPTGKPTLGPVPVRKGDPLCLYFDQSYSKVALDIYNAAGAKVGSYSFSGTNADCVATNPIAAGVYFARIVADGKETWQKVIVKP